MTTEQLYAIYTEYPIIATDTRKISPNSIFFALKGENFNGNKYAQSAIEKGSKYAIVDEPEYAISENIILVTDVLECLQDLSQYHRSQLKIPVIGITGSNGKTTTKELINTVLSTQYTTFATEGNLNNHIGVPLSLLKISNKVEIAIIEMGANHVGEIEFLCSLSQPDYGIITNIGKAHLEGFGSFENIIKTKTELYTSIKSKKGKIFINSDNSILLDNATLLNKVTYGSSSENNTSGRLEQKTTTLTFTYNNTLIHTKLVGNYNFENALAATAIGAYFGVSDNNIKLALENYIPVNNRSQLIMRESNTVIMDAYNANPVSTKMAIESLLSLEAENKLAILGDMRELGEYSAEEHKTIVDLLIANKINALLVGDEYSKVRQDKFNTYSNAQELSEYLKNNKVENTTILIKGSRGIKLETTLEHI
jgi:UDP-N-acetylmuramoyl-tripeptide--D-alanyl-D-alanine ligase